MVHAIFPTVFNSYHIFSERRENSFNHWVEELEEADRNGNCFVEQARRETEEVDRIVARYDRVVDLDDDDDDDLPPFPPPRPTLKFQMPREFKNKIRKPPRGV